MAGFKYGLLLLYLIVMASCQVAKNKKDIYCKSQQCVVIASKMDRAIDKTADPCFDFYDYVCGNFIKNTVIHDRFSGQDLQGGVEEIKTEHVRKSLEAIDASKDNKAFKSMKTFYKTCVSHDTFAKKGEKPILEAIEKLGGWPLLRKDAADSEWEILNNKIFQAGFTQNYLINFKLVVDPRDSSKYVIKIDPPEIHPLDNFYDWLVEGTDREEVKAYYEYMINTTTLLGADKTSASKEMLEVLNFEIEFWKLHKLNDAREKKYFTILQMNERFPYMNWKNFLESRMGNAFDLDNGVEVYLDQLKFFEELGGLMQKTPAKVTTNYFFWRISENSLPLTTKEVLEPALSFYKQVFQITQTQQKWKRCIENLQEFFSQALGALLARDKHIKINDEIKTMIKYIRDEAIQFSRKRLEISASDLVDLEKRMSDIRVDFGAIEEYSNISIIEDYHRDINFEDGKYFENVLKIRLFAAKKIGARLFKPVAETGWETFHESFFDTTHYERHKKYIFLSSTEFEPPNYDKNLPSYINYAGIGQTLAKQYSFALQAQAREVNYLLFDEKQDCILDQYELYLRQTLNLNFDATQTYLRNTAEVISYFLSYNAYTRSSDSQKLLLPSFNYTSDQFFWISSAQRYCTKDRHIQVTIRKILSEFPYERFRVINSVRNNENFGIDFDCPIGSGMNIASKC